MAAATDGIIVRVAGEGDLSSIAALSAQLGYPTPAADTRERYARVRAAQAGEVFVATFAADARVVGWTHVVPRLQLEEAPHAELAGLVVDETVRGTGVGAALLAAAEDWARGQGFAAMRVRSNVVRERAHRFYEREGYVRTKSQAVLRKTLT
ncbi:MAG: GNAT family N-acetyltransferase [Proteobacteria bacterium]|uniref:GNAT family N-acetyltransferase n=1 Tax=Rudaea sp. TaxID=2136325 RepID=UPI001E12E447|nr:GNAT family N-acetyltransferase [Pseudomonadota bacterium]MBS0568667.1 GNAT family N-acetyltransferase [Pseudomonadota bacterium]